MCLEAGSPVIEENTLARFTVTNEPAKVGPLWQGSLELRAHTRKGTGVRACAIGRGKVSQLIDEAKLELEVVRELGLEGKTAEVLNYNDRSSDSYPIIIVQKF